MPTTISDDDNVTRLQLSRGENKVDASKRHNREDITRERGWAGCEEDQ
jgi:hypothetical protein